MRGRPAEYSHRAILRVASSKSGRSIGETGMAAEAAHLPSGFLVGQFLILVKCLAKSLKRVGNISRQRRSPPRVVSSDLCYRPSSVPWVLQPPFRELLDC